MLPRHAVLELSKNSMEVRGQPSSRVSFYLQMLSNFLVQLF